MGCGLIALGLWFLLGLKINVNGTELVPPFIAYIIFIWGIITVLKRYKNKHLSYSLIISIVCLLFELLSEIRIFSILNCITSFLQLYFMLYGIEDIAKKYDNINIYSQKIKKYLIIFAILNIVVVISKVLNTETTLGVILVLIVFFYTISVCKHLYKINDYLYGLEEPVKIEKRLPRRKSYKIIAIMIMIITMIILLFSQNILSILTDRYSYESYYIVFKGDNGNIKVDDIEIYGYNQYSFINCEDSHIPYSKLYVNKDILKDAENIIRKIYVEDSQDFRYESHDSIISKKYYDNDLMEYEIDTEMTSNFQYNHEILNKITEGKVTPRLSITFLDKNNNEIETQTVELKPKAVKEYRYEDNDLVIKNVFTSEHTLMMESSYVRVKPSYYSFHKNTEIEVEVLDGNKSLISFNVDQDSTEHIGSIYRGELKSQPKIRINIYESDKLLDTKEYILEEIQ